MRTKDTLKQLQALPLELKIALTQQRIREWVRYYGESGVYISFSGGKDSTVLLHIARELYPELEAVFVSTGLEYPEIQQFAKSFPNVTVVYPKESFLQVMSDYGYPVISKAVSHCVGILRRKPNGKIAQNCFSPAKHGPFAMAKWQPIAHMDFGVSDKCCDYTKKQPARDYARKSGKVAITAQMACESALRTNKWIQNGCNAFDTAYPVSNPMSFWTEQDVMLYIKTRNIKICTVYGDVVYCDEQERFDDVPAKLKTTGCARTGCMFCAFGAHLEKGETRFQRLARTHPKQYAFCIGGGAYDTDGLWKPSKDGLGLGHVFDTLNSVYGDDFLRYKPLNEEDNNG